ncbi:aminoglycoside phosphotransferase family protein [Alkalicaulis satelles]|uniref:aminoglycoside phosphotransferase family protein n=1 Tax=Alkalicaulis satelles TaxID=2609175 RepID=UPI001E446750|nr:phosphotransferase [Alkalicaulis satelles]
MTASPDRAHARAELLSAAGWAGADETAFPGDASTRRYTRLSRHGRTALLMDAPGASEAPACPPGASAFERRALGYNARARLAGNNTAAFAALAGALTARGLSAPVVYAADHEAGFLVIEDLGDDLYARLIPERAHEGKLYACAVDALAALYRSSFEAGPEAFGQRWAIQAYDREALLAETELFLDWYAPERGTKPDESVRAAFEAAWTKAFAVLDAHAPGLNLRDFHAENLIWLPERQAEAQVGLLDFQDALFGHPAYDLVSLTEDARRDVSPDLARPLADRFFAAAGLADRDAFDAACAVLAAQRNAKILGIFVRLARRDSKPRYLQLLPRVARHFVRDIAHPALDDIRALVREAAPGVYAEADQ